METIENIQNIQDILVNLSSIKFFISVLFIIPSLFYLKRRKNIRNSTPPNGKIIPVVEGELPFVGHGVAFSKDIIGFVSSCYKKYGKIFRLKIYRINTVVICDRTLINEFFKTTEEHLSMYNVLDRLHFADAFSDRPDTLPRIINIVKKSVAMKYDTFVPKILNEAKKMIERLTVLASDGNDCNYDIDLIKEMTRFVATTSASCFTCAELTESTFEVLLKYVQLVNKCVVLTYFFPKWFLRIVANPFLSRYRKKVSKFIEQEIEKYRLDPNKMDSLVLRTAVDYIEPETGKCLNNEEVADVIVCLLYVSSENTALGLTNTIANLACNSVYWERCKMEAAFYLKNGDTKGLLASPIIHACVMESARLNAHIFALNRAPKDRTTTIGGYFVGDADSVAMCSPMLMVHGSAEEVFSNPEIYNPDRFLAPAKEKMNPYNVMTWGAGIHLCPGKIFSIYEIKIALALLLTKFEIRLKPESVSEINYFSPSAFAERKVQASLLPLSASADLYGKQIQPKSKSILVCGHKIEHFEEGGWLLRGYISREDQISLYKYVFNLSKNSVEHTEISSIPHTQAYPLAYHNLVYTGESNCPSPDAWYDWAQQPWELLYENKNENGFNGPKVHRFNSLYAQLFGEGGSMKMHTDAHVSWGISVNLGASVTFLFGSEKILLHSGDVFIADFSKVKHGVESIHDTSVPDWFSSDGQIIENFDRIRCSVQIRDLSDVKPFQKMSTEDFKDFLLHKKK